MVMEKVVIFAFVGELPCFAHALLNGLDMKKRGWDVKLVVEGAATRLLKELEDPAKPFASLYQQARAAGLIDCVCRACANMMGTQATAEAQGLPLCDELGGHPSMARYSEQGYRIITM